MAVSVKFKVCVTYFVLCYKVGNSIRIKNQQVAVYTNFLINTPIFSSKFAWPKSDQFYVYGEIEIRSYL